MKFPLADWIESHAGCRHDLGTSGMIGAVGPPVPSAREIATADPDALRRRLAERLSIDPGRVFLTHGATEANAAVLQFLAKRSDGVGRDCRVLRPEYPPLLDAAEWVGFRPVEREGPVAVAVTSQPRNPEGDLWDRERILRWIEGARDVLIDETFREFGGTPSLHALRSRGLWTTGSFTKFYAADQIRVGFATVPEEETEPFARFHGLLYNGLPAYSVAAAEAALRSHERYRRDVGRILSANRAAWSRAMPHHPVPVAPVAFDRSMPSGGGDLLADRCAERSILVCPGRYFGDPDGVRLCLTRPTFSRDLAAYLAVRDEGAGSVGVAPAGRGGRRRLDRPAAPPPKR